MKIRASRCPSCGYLCDHATDPADDSARPQPGDVSVCINCSSFLQYDGNCELQNLTRTQMGALDTETQNILWSYRRAIHKVSGP